MRWKCKYCEFMCEKRGYLLKHYRLKHRNYGRTVPFPCLHQECVCTFNSTTALKVHLAKIHQKTQGAQPRDTAQVTFQCQSCDFSAPCTEAVFLTHLRSTHLKVNHRESSVHLMAVTFTPMCILHLMHTEVRSTEHTTGGCSGQKLSLVV